MKNLKNNDLSNPDLNRLVEQGGTTILIAGLLLIVFAVLYPVQFDSRGDISFSERITGRFDMRLIKRDTITDVPRNVLLFIPFGFAVGSLLYRRRLGSTATLAATLVTAVGISFTGEVLQVWYPSRTPGLSDVLANGIGALLGYACFRRWGTEVLGYTVTLGAKVKARLTSKTLFVGFSVYVVLILLVSVYLKRGAALSDWDLAFPLILGNELTGDRPWRGYISEVHFADGVATDDQVARILSGTDPSVVMEDAQVVSYQLVGGGNYRDRTGNLSDLSWQGTPPSIQDERGVQLASDHWLMTQKSAAFLTQKLLESSQFTLITTVATADSKQWGPARIVSISGDPSNRNFTLGQGGTDLVVRLRTRMGQNGARPEVVVPDVFTDNDLHHLIISYDSVTLRIYVDGLEHAYYVALAPELTFFHFLLGTRWWRLRLNSADTGIYALLYYGLVFVPAGLLLGLVTVRGQPQSKLSRLAILAAILVPSAILEIILTTGTGIRLKNVLLGVVIIAGAMLLFRALATHFVQTDLAD